MHWRSTTLWMYIFLGISTTTTVTINSVWYLKKGRMLLTMFHSMFIMKIIPCHAMLTSLSSRTIHWLCGIEKPLHGLRLVRVQEKYCSEQVNCSTLLQLQIPAASTRQRREWHCRVHDIASTRKAKRKTHHRVMMMNCLESVLMNLRSLLLWPMTPAQNEAVSTGVSFYCFLLMQWASLYAALSF